MYDMNDVSAAACGLCALMVSMFVFFPAADFGARRTGLKHAKNAYGLLSFQAIFPCCGAAGVAGVAMKLSANPYIGTAATILAVVAVMIIAYKMGKGHKPAET